MFTKSSQKNQHSTLDIANNKCYITPRTKERDAKEGYEVSPMSSLNIPVPEKHGKQTQYFRKGEMTYVNAQYFWRKFI